MAPQEGSGTVRSRFIPKGIGEEEWKNMSLVEKWKTTYERDPMDLMASKWPSRAGMVFVLYSVITYFYVNVRYVIPEYFENFSDTSRYYFTVMFVFIVIQFQANWLCMFFYSSNHRASRDNPPEEALTPVLAVTVDPVKKPADVQPKNKKESMDSSSSRDAADDKDIRQTTKEKAANQILMEDIHSNKTGLVWGYCDKCELPAPPRSHHCKVCDACVLKRDHHCYFANTCVGFYNQRYFVICTFYMALGCFLGFVFEGLYLMWKLSDGAGGSSALSSYWNLFLPVTFYKSFISGELSLYYAYIVGHLYSFPPVGVMSVGFFLTQMTAISVGRTTHEMSKRVRIKSLGDSAHNFRSVFGGFWGLNFVFPAVLIFRQEGNGKHWSDMKKY